MTTLNRKLDNEQAVLWAIKGWLSTHSYSPSFRELETETGISLGTVHEICHDLRDGGKIVFADKIARSISLPKKGK